MSPRTLVWGVWLLGLTTGVLAVLGLRAWHERGARGDLERFAAVRAFAEEAYVGGVDGDALLEDALSGMLEGLDRYSRFYPPEDAAQLERETGGRYEGIGALFRTLDGVRRVLFTLPDSPAREGGLTVGDGVLAIDGVTITEEMDDAAFRARLAPESGAPVKLLVVDLEGVESTLTVHARALVDPSLRHVRLLSETPRIGWISIETFSRETPGEVDRALADLEDGAPLDGLVLDLRGNLGGVLDAAVALTGRFLPEGVIVRTRGRDEEEVLQAVPSRCTHPDLDLVVLVDGSSASASEVVAGALQDHRRAVLVGTPTYGKGVVQTIRRFEPWGARAKVTTAWYTSPSGRNFESSATPGREQGLAPDLEVAVSDEAAGAVRAWLRAHQPLGAEAAAVRAWEEAEDRVLLPPAPEDPVLDAALTLLQAD